MFDAIVNLEKPAGQPAEKVGTTSPHFPQGDATFCEFALPSGTDETCRHSAQPRITANDQP